MINGGKLRVEAFRLLLVGRALSVFRRAGSRGAEKQPLAVGKNEVAAVRAVRAVFRPVAFDVSSVPGLSEFFVKPRLSSVFGVPPSIIHVVTVPSGFLTSR